MAEAVQYVAYQAKESTADVRDSYTHIQGEHCGGCKYISPSSPSSLDVVHKLC